jgi:hypothetical protein
MNTFPTWRGMRKSSLLAALVACALAGTTISAGAETLTAAPGWEVTPIAYPSHLKPGGKGYLVLAIYNVGKAASSGQFTVTDTLPEGVTATEAGYTGDNGANWNCSAGGTTVTCTNNEGEGGMPSLPPGQVTWLAIAVDVSGSVSGSGLNQVTVAGGGAYAPANESDTLNFESTPEKFGFQSFDAWFSNADGTLDTQAGSHPYSLTVSLALEDNGEDASGEARNITVNLPRGLIGNPTVIPRCTAAQLNAAECPADSEIGVDHAILGGAEPLERTEGENISINEYGPDFVFAPSFGVFNMVPPPGVPAQLGFSLEGIGVNINAGVQSAGEYNIAAAIHNIPQREITFNTLTIWGNPADPSHDYQRRRRAEEGLIEYGVHSDIAPVPFLTMPTSCEGPKAFTGTTEEWPKEGLEAPISEASVLSHESSGLAAGITGCDDLSFDPKMVIAPETNEAETPAGLTVELKTPQEGLTAVEGLATSNIKDTTVTLPEGVAINPGQAHGLQTCSEAQSAVGTESEPTCPNASKVGTDEIETPLLFHGLKGNVYVLDSNPPNLKLLVAASGEGVNLKLIGDVHLDESTGRLTSTFKETPELPFTDFKLSFSGGAQAALYTPARCGSYRSSSDFTPWSTPSVADAFPTSEFLITSGANGSSCASTLPFSPSLTAGSTTDQAGGYTNFSLMLARDDGQQRIEKLQFKTPKGLLGMISEVPLCEEPQAAAGTCSAASQIGHTEVEAGPGPYPLVVPEPGQAPAPIYLTGGYKGAPYGLSIVVPVIAGPFNLGTIVVRASIAVDPYTAQLTVTTDPLPTIIDGIPTDLRSIDAVIDRPGFMFNPTNCSPQEFAGTATSTEDTSVPISSHFQMGSCRSLTFKPDFKVSTAGQSSKANGTSLEAKIVYPTTPLGANQASSQANIASVKVSLPIQMPSRLTTLQKACLAKVFEEDPSNCPKESLVGSATAITPVLPVPLTGPAYFVSHGGEAFPSLIVVLQGYGVTVNLVGTTFISKAGITSSTFKQVPDVPITSFDLKLPQGPYSALAANLPSSAHYSYCGQHLVMPTDFVAQNGAEIKQSTPITIEGCSHTLSIKSTVKKQTVTLTVYAPAAGKITAVGKGLPTIIKTAKGQENVTIALKQAKPGRRRAAIKVSFKPSTGKQQSKIAKVKFTS